MRIRAVIAEQNALDPHRPKSPLHTALLKPLDRSQGARFVIVDLGVHNLFDRPIGTSSRYRPRLLRAALTCGRPGLRGKKIDRIPPARASRDARPAPSRADSSSPRP